MGFQNWYLAVLFIIWLGLNVLVPCVFIALIGSNMINDLGNFPTKAAKTQVQGSLWLLLVLFFTALAFYVFYVLFC